MVSDKYEASEISGSVSEEDVLPSNDDSHEASSTGNNSSGGLKSWVWLPIVLMLVSIAVLVFVNVNEYKQRKLQKAADAKLERYRKGLVGEDEMLYSDDSADIDSPAEDDYQIDNRYFSDAFGADESVGSADDYDPYNITGRDSYELPDNRNTNSSKDMKNRIDDNPFV